MLSEKDLKYSNSVKSSNKYIIIVAIIVLLSSFTCSLRMNHRIGGRIRKTDSSIVKVNSFLVNTPTEKYLKERIIFLHKEIKNVENDLFILTVFAVMGFGLAYTIGCFSYVYSNRKLVSIIDKLREEKLYTLMENDLKFANKAKSSNKYYIPLGILLMLFILTSSFYINHNSGSAIKTIDSRIVEHKKIEVNNRNEEIRKELVIIVDERLKRKWKAKNKITKLLLLGIGLCSTISFVLMRFGHRKLLLIIDNLVKEEGIQGSSEDV